MSIRRSARFSSSNSVSSTSRRVRFAIANTTRKPPAKRITSDTNSKEKIHTFKQTVRSTKQSNNSRQTRNSEKDKSREDSSIERVPSPKTAKPSSKEKKLSSSNAVNKLVRKKTNKPETKSKKPSKATNKTRGSKLKQQMKLGKIFVKPNFPIKSVTKKNTNSDDNEGKQGQTITSRRPEMNNNVLMKSLQPRIVLCKIDQPNSTPIRETRSKRRLC